MVFIRFLFLLFASTVSLSSMPEVVSAQKPLIYAGVAQVNITPPVGYSHYRGVSTGVHDSLYAKAVVWGKGDQRFALVVCDVVE